MWNNTMKLWLDSSFLTGTNQSYIEKLYEDFLLNPDNIDSSWNLIFKKFICNSENTLNKFCFETKNYSLKTNELTKDDESLARNNSDIHYKQFKIIQLINAFRCYGYLNANLDPLDLWERKNIPDLDPTFYNFNESDFQKTFNIIVLNTKFKMLKLVKLYNILRKIYCGSIGIEYMHINNIKERYWIQKQIESSMGEWSFNSNEKLRFLDELTASEGLEYYLGKKFPGAKRFSLEGCDVLIPLLKEIIYYSGNNDIREVVLGMAHRGRLNVLVNIFGKNPQDLFNEFIGIHKDNKYLSRTGDVKYHQGFSSNVEINGNLVHLVLAFNPSHLEIINPVIMGSARARIDRLNKQSNKILPITIHGDAAFIGQGVIQETLNMSQISGYDVGGTIRIIVNNQIGFTMSNENNITSNNYCTNVTKIIQPPIFHVNADDLEAVIFVTRIALKFRSIFKRDVIIDLICYRRHGHNESDEPSVTQPLMYKKIKQHLTLRKIYSSHLETEGLITHEKSENMIKTFRNMLIKGKCTVKEFKQTNMHSYIWQDYLSQNWDELYSRKVEKKHLKQLAYTINKLPSNIKVHPLVTKIYNDRIAMALEKKPFDWGAAETLAYATLINKGISIRLSGEDTTRGTFFHRHAVIHDQNNGDTYIPLTNICNKQGIFYILDSVLSEEAVLAFEYGYAITEPRTMVIWEAQFGDFSNVAQVIIDQFISSGEQKWGKMCGMVMLLPHGYEGQGPEHSSARLERYLQLCAEQNMQICVPSTPSQIYHVLRRQALRSLRRPLIIISPKSLLRHPISVSTLNELANGKFQTVIGEIDNIIEPKKVERIIICSGKVYYDLLIQRRLNKQQNIAIIRIEQLYPFPLQQISEILSIYTCAKDFIWCQEEPQNQGAWFFSYHNLCNVIPNNALLNYSGRPAAASPAVGNLSIHQIQQKTLIDNALNIKQSYRKI